jgi:non-specific serine/threonine protein kinase
MALRHREATAATDRTPDGLSGGSSLPALLTRLIGRDASIVAGCDLLARSRLVTLTGPGGIGKTQLALAIGHKVADRFPGGVAFVELATVLEPDLVLPAVAATLGLRGTSIESIEQRLKRYLSERQMLLILDNAEHLLDAAPDIAGLLAASAHLRILVTSRSPLNLRGEHAFDVPPLTIPPRQHAQSPAELARYPAMELFVRQAQATDAAFRLTDTNVEAVASICARLDGIPLAIELAASRIRVLSPGGILSLLDQQLLLLTGGPRDQPPRLQTMRSAISWSYDLLDAGQQELFRRLAVFSGGWTLDTAVAVCQPEGHVLEAMTSLITWSLVRRIAEPAADARFVMLEPIRQFALEQLVDSGEIDAVRSRHANVFLALAEEASPHLDWRDQTPWMRRLDPEHDNFRTAISWLLERHEAERGLRFIAALSWFWNIRGYFLEARASAQAFLNLPEARGRTVERARALGALAYLLDFLGDYEQAKAFGEEALAINDETGDRRGRARILIPLITTAYDMRDDRRHLQLSEDLLRTARAIGDQENIARALVRLGMDALRGGDFEQAFTLYTQALELARRLENRATTALALASIGDVYYQLGDLARATTIYRDSHSIYVDYNYARPIARGFERLAATACASQQWQRAARLYAAAAARCAAIGIDFPIADRDDVDTDIAAIRASLTDEQFQSAWDQGQAMSFADAVAYALEMEPEQATATPPVAGKLSPRECDVLRLIAAGQSNKQIAAELFLSVHTIERHITNLYAKIGARGRADATAWALRHDLA